MSTPQSHGVLLLGSLLKELRAKQGKSLDAAADVIGIDRRTLGRAERGQQVAAETAKSIASYYNIEFDRIIDTQRFAINSKLTLITSFHELLEVNIEIIKTARKYIICFGSRSRDSDYLRLIEDTCKKNKSLIYKRILFVKPFHQEMQNHLLRIMEIRTPYDREAGFQTLYICAAENLLMQPEINICMNEHRANFVLPSINMPGLYDSSLLLEDSLKINGWATLANDMCRNCRVITTKNDIIELGIMSDGGKYV